MMAPDAALNGLKRQRPEWSPWLAVVEATLHEIGVAVWDRAVPADAPARPSRAPLLAGATFTVELKAVRRWLQRLLRMASRTGMPGMASLDATLAAHVDLARLFTASLCQDSERITAAVNGSAAHGDAFHAVLALLPVPLLQACSRRWASALSASWVEGYCPVCGSLPAFAEVRGIERSRYFRCARCGGAWHARALWCPYCDTSDHDALVSLVPEPGGSTAAIEACTRCLGYVKTLTRLQGCPPDTVMIDDLATVNLDVGALEHGYRRPAGGGYALDVNVTDTRATRRRFFAWTS